MLIKCGGGDLCPDIWVPKGHHTWMLVEDGAADLHPGVLSAAILYKRVTILLCVSRWAKVSYCIISGNLDNA